MPSSQLVAESPRIAPAIDLPATADWTDASPRGDQSLRGHTSEEAEDFPRHYPPAIASSLIEAAGEGFTVMSGSSHRVTSVQGNSLTRQGISLELSTGRPVARTISSSPYRLEVAGVWPLRIPNAEWFSDTSQRSRADIAARAFGLSC
jgi:hypothetical protein